MATILSHGVCAAAIGTAFPAPKALRFWICGILCSMIPDADVIGFRFGIQYGDMLGHRGLTHSFAFAFLFTGLATAVIHRMERPISWRRLWLYLFLSMISHAILDGFTNGGLGVAFFAPFSNTRYFFPWNPIRVSPIGSRFFSARGLGVLVNEVLWIWLPSALFSLAMWAFWKMRNRSLAGAPVE